MTEAHFDRIVKGFWLIVTELLSIFSCRTNVRTRHYWARGTISFLTDFQGRGGVIIPKRGVSPACGRSVACERVLGVLTYRQLVNKCSITQV